MFDIENANIAELEAELARHLSTNPAGPNRPFLDKEAAHYEHTLKARILLRRVEHLG